MVKKVLLFFFVSVMLISCDDENNKRSLPSPSGQSGEVVVWCSEGFWKGEFGDSIKKVLRKPVYGLPQSEPLFDLQHATDETFGSVFKTFANIIILDVDKDRFTDPVIEVKRNVWAKRQVVVKIKAKSRIKAAEFFMEKGDDIIGYFNTAERNRLIKHYKASSPEVLDSVLKEKFNIEAHFMKEAYLAKEDSNVLWVRSEREKEQGGYAHQISQGFVFTTSEYVDREQINNYSLLNVTDSILKATVPGPVDKSYMRIDEEYVPARSKAVDHNGHYAVEMKGLWRTEGYIMGGPWYALHIVNTDENVILSCFGYVYAPQFKKRKYRREVEAALNSVRFVSEPENTPEEEAS